jgi:hypothetical protein
MRVSELKFDRVFDAEFMTPPLSKQNIKLV